LCERGPGQQPPSRAVTAYRLAEAVFELYREQVDLTDAIITTTSLDAARELIDGRTWLVLD
jgi:hypothetical protein